MILKKTLLLTLIPIIQNISAADSPDSLSVSVTSQQFSQDALMIGVIDSLISGTIKLLPRAGALRCFVKDRRTAVQLINIQSLLLDAQKEIVAITENAKTPQQTEYNFFTKFPIINELKESEKCTKHFAFFELHSFTSQSTSQELKMVYNGLMEKKTLPEIAALLENVKPVKVEPLEQRYNAFVMRYYAEFHHDQHKKTKQLALQEQPLPQISPEASFPCCNTL